LLAVVVALAGCGGAGVAVEAKPSHVDLGEVAFQGKTVKIPVSLHNRTRSAVRIEYPRVEGDTPARVATAGTTCLAGKSVAAGASCLVMVSLRADRFGEMKGQLIVSYDQKGSPVTVPITATGGGIPDLQVLTSRLDFGQQPVGGSPARAFISLASRGTAAAWSHPVFGSDAGRVAPGKLMGLCLLLAVLCPVQIILATRVFITGSSACSTR
jgi:hypothetical protein